MMRVFVEMFLRSPEENIEIAKRLGLGVELFLKTHILMELTASRIKDWKSSVIELKGIATHGPYKDLVPGSFDPLIREATLRRFLQAISISSEIGAEWVVFHLNFNEHVYGHSKTREIWIRNALMLFGELVSKRFLFLLENTEEKDPDIFMDIVKRVDSKYIGVCFDVGHAYAFSNKDLHEWIHKLAPYIREVHLHESKRGIDAHLPLGSGYIDVNSLLASLEEEASSDFVITLEPRSEEDLYKDISWLRENGWF